MWSYSETSGEFRGVHIQILDDPNLYRDALQIQT